MNASSVVNPLISASELLGALEGGSPLVLVDARFWLGQHGRGRAAYEAGHIPGARFVDVDEELAEPARGDGIRPGTSARGRHPRPSAERLTGAVGRLGINDDSSVVVYDQGTSLAAAWFRWLLRDAGQLNIRVLDGGFAAWQAAGGAVSTDDPADGTGSFVPQPGQLPALTVDEVPGFLAAGHQLVDVRAAERFRGETEPVDPIAGHIPGASNLPASTLQQADGRFLPAADLRVHLSGIAAGDAFSCGSGLTASQALLAAESAGIDGLAIYPGSWSEWIADPARPVAVGGGV